MTPTNEDIALALDPEKRVPDWWEQLFYPKGAIEKCEGVWLGFVLRQGHRVFETMRWTGDTRKLEATGEWRCTAPDFLHDDLACFVHLRPVLHALGCSIKIYATHTWVEYTTTGSAWSAPIFCESLCLALSYFMQHDPDALARAVKEVRG
jgi:hypothetical protein